MFFSHNILNNFKSVSEFRESVANSIEQVKSNKQPLVLTQQGKPAAIMIDIESFNELTNNYEVVAHILQGLKDSMSGKTQSTESLKGYFKKNGKLD